MTIEERARNLLIVERLCAAARRRKVATGDSPRRGGAAAAHPSGQAGGQWADGPGAPGAAEWDWTRPHRFTARQRGRLQALADRVAGRVAAELAGVLLTKAEVEASAVAERYAASLRSDETPAFWVELREGSGGPAARRPAGLVRFPAPLAGEWVDKLLGAAPRGPDPARRLSAMETALLAYIAGAVGGALAAACQEGGSPPLRPGEQVLAALPPDLLAADDEVCEFMLRRAGADDGTALPGGGGTGFQPVDHGQDARGGSPPKTQDPKTGSRVRGIGSGGTTPDPRPKTLPFCPAGGITVFLRSDLLGPVADPASAALPPQRPEDARAAVLGHFEKAPVTVTARLGTADVKVRDLVSLAPGDVVVLRTGPEDPVTVAVDGVGIVRGRPARCEGRYAVHVREFRRHPRQKLEVARASSP